MRLEGIGTHFGMKGSAIRQLSRRFQERMTGNEDLRGILDRIRREGLLNVAARPLSDFLVNIFQGFSSCLPRLFRSS